jgi:uncharacterized protein (TIGR02145 family)
MAENLRTVKYTDGCAITIVSDNQVWANLSTAGYCWYDNDEIQNKQALGGIYNWYAAASGKICPTGWHVPTGDDYSAMVNYLISNGFNYDGSRTGNKIAKALSSTSDWQISSIKGTPGNPDYPEFRNKTGFTALPAGNRGQDGKFYSLGSSAQFWSSSGVDDVGISRLILNDPAFTAMPVSKNNGFSIRCLKD